MLLTIDEFKNEHLKQLDAVEPLSHMYDLDAEVPGSYTLRDESGDIVACLGINPTRHHFAIAWAVVSKTKAPPVKTKLIRTCLYILHSIVRGAELTRVETYVQKDFTAGRKFVEVCGFIPECVMSNYDGYTDYVLYSFCTEKDHENGADRDNHGGCLDSLRDLQPDSPIENRATTVEGTGKAAPRAASSERGAASAAAS